ncbi:MAG TPA: hypothetical protein VMM14_02055 [Acidimicrobiia bacterium]|nr:hypothetical protein [Acidimicrobiia bacterium]
MHRTTAELQLLLEGILDAPKEAGPIEMIVRRPGENQRDVVESAELSVEHGLLGDNWIDRVGRDGRFRGVTAFVVDGGVIRVGDKITKI